MAERRQSPNSLRVSARQLLVACPGEGLGLAKVAGERGNSEAVSSTSWRDELARFIANDGAARDGGE